MAPELFTLPCRYALQGLIELARREAIAPVRLRELVGDDVPIQFLSKIFHGLVRAQLLRSTRGPGGGFTLARDPAAITVAAIVTAVDGQPSVPGCALTRGPCDVDAPCPLHDGWARIQADIDVILHHTTLQDLASRRS